MKYEYTETYGGVKITFNRKIVGWITTRVNGQFGYIPTRCEKDFKSPSFNTFEEAKEAFETKGIDQNIAF